MRRLIITGDDFGASPQVNAAIERHHRAGFLTQASLMVHAPAVADAVEIARRNPRLLTGLHLVVCESAPALNGIEIFFSAKRRARLREEVEGQFDSFRALGFPPTYWDGHMHLHLHPTALRLALPVAQRHGFRAIRLVRERSIAPLPLIFRALSVRAMRAGFRHSDHTFGLAQTGRTDTEFVEKMMRKLPPGLNEFYYHPGAEPSDLDLPRLVSIAQQSDIQLATVLDG
jgi:predicted glycoside hydrolase/deacetylase ChbG (UPF0249 family)